MSKHQLWNELGNVYINSGAFEEAIQAYRKSIEISPEFGWAYNNMALAYMRLGQPEISIPYYQRSIELLTEFKDKAVAWHRMGNSYQVMDDIENAVLAFQRAVNLDLDNTKYRHDLAVAKAEYAYEEEEVKDEAPETEEERSETVVEDKEIEALDEALVEEEEAEQDGYSSWIEKTIEKLADKALKKKAAAFEYETIVFPEGVAPEEAVAELMTLVEGQSVEALLSEDEELAEKESNIEELPELEIEEQVVDEAPLPESEELAEDVDSSEELPVLETDTDEEESEEAAVVEEDSDNTETLEPAVLQAEAVEGVEVIAEKKEEDAGEDEQVEIAQKSTSPVPAAIAKDLIPAFAAVEDEELDASLQNLMSEISQEIDVDENDLEEDTFFVSEEEEEFLDEIAEEIEENIVEEVLAQEVAEKATDEVVITEDAAAEEVAETTIEDPVAENHDQTEEDLEPVGLEEEKLEVDEDVTEEVEIAMEEPVLENPEEDLDEESNDDFEEELQEEEGLEDYVASLENPEEVTKEESVFNKIISDKGNGNGNGNGNGSVPDISSARVWSELGNVFYREGIFDGAQIAYKKAIELDDKFGLAFNNLALLHVHDGKYEEAVQLYETSIDLIENSTAQAVSWNNLGNAHRALKAYDEAEKAYRKADDLVGEKIAIENSTRYGLLDDASAL